MTRDEVIQLKNIQICGGLMIEDANACRYKYGLNVTNRTYQYYPFCIIVSDIIYGDFNFLYDYRKMSELLLQKEYLTEVYTKFYAPIKTDLVKRHNISTLSFDTAQHIINENTVLFQKVNEKFKQDSIIVQLG